MKVLFTTICAIVSLTASVSYANGNNYQSTPQNQEVHVVAFLEPKCADSKRYNNEVFPQFEKEFMGKPNIYYSVIVTSFLPKSMPAAMALLCVYHDQANEQTNLFYDYLNYIYKIQPPKSEDWATNENMLKYAAATSPKIDQNELKQCLKNETYKSEVEKNTAYGEKLMGELRTPTVYVNGVKVKSSQDRIEYADLRTAVQQALNKK